MLTCNIIKSHVNPNISPVDIIGATHVILKIYKVYPL